jgi:hypothetical protein
MFHSQGSLFKFQIFKSHLVKRTAVPSADGHKDFSLGLTYFANEFFHEVGNVDLTDMMAAENPKNEMFRAFSTLMALKRLELVLSQQMANIWSTTS